jgi:hypothetical protein
MNTFPQPPGALGSAPSAADLLDYLGRLDSWVLQARAELDALDAQVLATKRQAELDSDMSLAMSSWQTIKARQDLLLSTWDSGRVGPKELDTMANLIWGRLDNTAASLNTMQSMAVSLPEAGRLCDALLAQLRTQLDTDPNATTLQIRLTQLRAQAERIRDQLKWEPPALAPAGQAKLQALVARTIELADKHNRGGDIAGLLTVLEADAALLERDLIVASSRRREGRDLVAKVRAEHAGFTAQLATVTDLAEQVRAAIWPMPSVDQGQLAALGPIPNTADAIKQYLADLATATASLSQTRTALGDLLAQRDNAARAWAARKTRSTQMGHGDDPVLAGLAALIDARIAAVPMVLPTVRALLAAFDAELDYLSKGGRR